MACGEAICACVALLLQCCQEGESHAHTLWISHMHLPHGHLLCSELAPLCINCSVPFSVSHVLVECPHYGEACLAYHLHGMLSSKLDNDCHSISNVLAFLNAIGLATST